MAVEYVAPPPGQPFGGIVNASMPELQQTEQQLGQIQLYQNRMAQQQRIREQALFDRMQNQEIAKVRSIDAPQVADAFTNWRSAQIAEEQYKGHDAQAYNQLSMSANQAYANAMQRIQKSAELKNQAVQMQADYKAHPDKYADNFPDLMHAMLDTPYDQLNNVKVGQNSYDLSNQNSYLYPGGNINYAAAEKEAIGTPKQVYTDSQQVPGGLQTQNTPYLYGNTPAEYKRVLYSKLATNAGNRDARYQLSRLLESNPNAIQNISNAYNSLSQNDWLQRTGQPAPQNLEPTNPNDPAEVYASYLAKQYALNNIPKVGEPKFVTNVLNQDLKKEQLAERMEGIRQGNREDIVALRHYYTKADAKDQAAFVDNYVGSDANRAIQGGKTTINPTTGQTEYRPNSLDQNILKQGITGNYSHKKAPDTYAYNSDGSQFRYIYYATDRHGNKIPDGQGGYVEDTGDGKGEWQPVSGLKATLGKQFGTIPEAKAYNPAPTPSEKSYIANGKTYTHNQLLGMGYTEQQIQQALQNGTLK